MRFFLVSLTISLCFFGTLAQSNSERRFHYGQVAPEADEFFAPLLRQPLFGFQELEYKCGGTWIHDSIVLTTAYCLKYHDINRVGLLDAGKKTTWLRDDKYVKWIAKKHYFANYSYEGEKRFENNIGLVKIKGRPNHPKAFFPRIFDDWGNLEAIETNRVVLFGYGRTETGNYAPKLKYMRGRLHISDAYSRDKCTVPACRKGLSFCFEPQAARDRADNGDMGSPVYYKLDNPNHPEQKNRILIGILSDFDYEPRNIILTNVTRYKDWIKSLLLSW